MVSAAEKRNPPFVVVLGGSREDKSSRWIESLGGSVSWVNSLDELRQEDFDYIVDLDGSANPWIRAGQSLISFSNSSDHQEVARLGSRPAHHGFGTEPAFSVRRFRGDSAHDFEHLVTHGNPDTDERLVAQAGRLQGALLPLVNAEILPNLERGGSYSVLAGDSSQWSVSWLNLVEERNGSALATICLTDSAMYWLLPESIQDKASWVRAFFEECDRVRPERFPNWTKEVSGFWRTADEQTAIARLEDFDSETLEINNRRSLDRESLVAEVGRTSREADENDRALLHSSGDDLVKNVAIILESFGFSLTDMDEVAELQGSNKQEDLQARHVRLAGDDWVALVEVKSFTRGAKSSALQQIQKAAGIYEGRVGRPPTALWYVVNAEKEKPLDARGEVLRGAEEEVEVFSKDGGLVVDAKVLFQIDKKVKSGEWTADEAAEYFLGATGILEYPPVSINGD